MPAFMASRRPGASVLEQKRLRHLDDEPRRDAGAGAEMGREHRQPFAIPQGRGRDGQDEARVGCARGGRPPVPACAHRRAGAGLASASPGDVGRAGWCSPSGRESGRRPVHGGRRVARRRRAGAPGQAAVVQRADEIERSLLGRRACERFRGPCSSTLVVGALIAVAERPSASAGAWRRRGMIRRAGRAEMQASRAVIPHQEPPRRFRRCGVRGRAAGEREGEAVRARESRSGRGGASSGASRGQFSRHRPSSAERADDQRAGRGRRAAPRRCRPGCGGGARSASATGHGQQVPGARRPDRRAGGRGRRRGVPRAPGDAAARILDDEHLVGAEAQGVAGLVELAGRAAATMASAAEPACRLDQLREGIAGPGKVAGGKAEDRGGIGPPGQGVGAPGPSR